MFLRAIVVGSARAGQSHPRCTVIMIILRRLAKLDRRLRTKKESKYGRYAAKVGFGGGILEQKP